MMYHIIQAATHLQPNAFVLTISFCNTIRQATVHYAQQVAYPIEKLRASHNTIDDNTVVHQSFFLLYFDYFVSFCVHSQIK